MNYLLLTILIPIINALIIGIKYDGSQEKSVLVDLSSKIFPILFCAILFGLLRNYKNNYFEIIEFNSLLTFGFEATKSSIKQIFILAFLWLIFMFYSDKFLLLVKQNSAQLKLFLTIFIALLNLIILSSNLITMLFCYSLLVLFFIFLFNKKLLKTDNKLSYIFIFLTIFEVILLLLAIIMTAQFSNDIAFAKDGVAISASKTQTLFILALYLGAMLTTILTASYLLFCNNFHFDSLYNYLVWPLFYGFAKLFIFSKIITQIFGLGLFSNLIPHSIVNFIEFVFLINILLTLGFMLFSKNFKSIFLHLFFNQLNFAFLTIFVFAVGDEGNISNVVIAFMLAITLIFIGFSNLVLYLTKAENKDFGGLFYDLKITISLMIFGLLSFAGIAPSVNMAQNLSLLRIILANKSVLVFAALILNGIGIALFTYKLFFTSFSKNVANKSPSDKMIADKIDNSSSTVLSGLIIALAMFLLSIIQFFYE